jgi:hypothetical protein
MLILTEPSCTPFLVAFSYCRSSLLGFTFGRSDSTETSPDSGTRSLPKIWGKYWVWKIEEMPVLIIQILDFSSPVIFSFARNGSRNGTLATDSPSRFGSNLRPSAPQAYEQELPLNPTPTAYIEVIHEEERQVRNIYLLTYSVYEKILIERPW